MIFNDEYILATCSVQCTFSKQERILGSPIWSLARFVYKDGSRIIATGWISYSTRYESRCSLVETLFDKIVEWQGYSTATLSSDEWHTTCSHMCETYKKEHRTRT
jgi:hypothetical protein